MWLAIDTATDRASVAAGFAGAPLATESITGSRSHATRLLTVVRDVLRQAGARLAELEGIALADGPGSFTGLRVGAAVAKALVETHRTGVWVGPSLLGAAAAEPHDGRLVLALSDALRGELFAAAYRITPGRVETVLAPSVHRPESLRAALPAPDAVVGPAAVQWGSTPTFPSAAALLSLLGFAGGLHRLPDPRRWQPDYGRPAEAQVQWERAHGRPLQDSAGRPG
jgi:tRNA threonylcarbamoyl adenosine modification protein YeaZ